MFVNKNIVKCKNRVLILTKVIQDVWILDDNGIVLFNRVFDDKIEVQLFGGLMSALNSFAQQLAEGGLKNFEISNKRFTLIKKKGLLFIANSSKKFKEKKVILELEIIAQKFNTQYPDDFFKKWDHDINLFSDFKNEIENALEDPVKKFWDGF